MTQALFALEAHGGNPETVLAYVVNEFGDEVYDVSFAEKTLKGVMKHRESIQKIVVEAAPEWPMDKIALLDLVVLEIGIYEIMYHDEVPDLVAINEAVELSKEFGGYNNSKFINGVLSNVMHHKTEYSLL